MPETQAAFREQDLCGRDVFSSIHKFGQFGRSPSAFALQPVKFRQAYILPKMEEQWTLLDTAYAANRTELALEMGNEGLQDLGRSPSAFAPQPVKFHQAYILPEMEEQWTLLDTAYAANRTELALEMGNEGLQDLVDHMDKIPR